MKKCKKHNRALLRLFVSEDGTEVALGPTHELFRNDVMRLAKYPGQRFTYKGMVCTQCRRDEAGKPGTIRSPRGTYYWLGFFLCLELSRLGIRLY